MKLSKEQEKLVLENQRLVDYLVLKTGITQASLEYDDRVSMGTIGLIKAAMTFDETKKVKFATYAARCINNEFYMYFRKTKKQQQECSLDEPIAGDPEGNEITLAEIIPNTEKSIEEEFVDRSSLEKYVNIILNLLNPRDRTVMLYRIAGVNQPDIAKKLKISQSYISRIEKKLKKKVETYYEIEKQFEEVYSMSFTGDSYKISFSTRDVKNFSKIFALFLNKLSENQDLPNYTMNCNKERIMIQVEPHPESFSFIAQILEQIDEFSMKFEQQKIKSNNDKLQINRN